MNMKSLNKYQGFFNNESFDLDHEAKMVQSRILSTLLGVIEDKGITQEELEELTGLKQPFISAIFNSRKRLNMEHIALFQRALDIVLQPPMYLTKGQHKSKFYHQNEYEDLNGQFLETACYHSMSNILQLYISESELNGWSSGRKETRRNMKNSTWQNKFSEYDKNIVIV